MIIEKVYGLLDRDEIMTDVEMKAFDAAALVLSCFSKSRKKIYSDNDRIICQYEMMSGEVYSVDFSKNPICGNESIVPMKIVRVR